MAMSSLEVVYQSHPGFSIDMRETYAICGQLNRFVPEKRVQLFPALAKLSSGFAIVTRKAS